MKFLPEWELFIAEQNYQEYSSEDHNVWKQFITRQHQMIKEYSNNIHPAYKMGFNQLKLSPDKIPTLMEINTLLHTSGWSVVCVNGYLPASVYAYFITRKKFPISYVIRKLRHINHSPEPDFIHDVVGHLPMLFNKDYCEYVHQIAQLFNSYEDNELDKALYQANLDLAYLEKLSNRSNSDIQEKLKEIERIQNNLKLNPSNTTLLNRMILWSIEFGLIGTVEEYQCYGAGILSAPIELNYICKENINVTPYSLDVINYDINFTEVQNNFFVINKFSELTTILNEFKILLENRDLIHKNRRLHENMCID